MPGQPKPLSRRAFVALGGSTALLAAGGMPFVRMTTRAHARASTRLSSRPGKPSRLIEPGLHQLGLSVGPRDGQLYVPKTLNPKKAAPILLALHGATQNHEVMITRLTSLADSAGCALLAPDSRGMTWDAIRGEFGDDPAFIDRALAWTFDRLTIDAARVWLCGFSDGASYGISLGLANGDFIRRVLAFSPGFVIPAEHRGTPRIFVSHGRQDQILPIDQCSRRIVPALKAVGYDVRFDEFEGGHRMPPEILTAAAEWLRS
jgi:predicted esterase